MFSLEPVSWDYNSRITHFSVFASAINIVIVVIVISFPVLLFRDTQGRTQAQFKRVPRRLHNYIVITINDKPCIQGRVGGLHLRGLYPGKRSASEGEGVCVQEGLHPGVGIGQIPWVCFKGAEVGVVVVG